MTDTAERTSAPARTGQPGANGAGQSGPSQAGAAGDTPPAASPAPPAAPRRRLGQVRLAAIVVVTAIALIAGGLAAYRFWYDSTHFVATNNAQIAGRLTQVGGPTAGRVVSIRYDIGERVERDAVVAVLQVPVPVGTTSSGVPRLEYRATSDSLIEVRAPISGVVIARGAAAGDTVPAGHALLTLVDPTQLWVTANIEETQIRRIQLGQPATVTVDSLAIDMPGRVVAITPASAATFSLLPQQNFSGNFTHVTQLVPVRIALDTTDPRLMIGTSTSVRIEVVPTST